MRLGRTLTIALLATLLGMFPAAISPLSADGLLEGCTIYDADDANLIESAKQRVAERNAQIAGGEGYLAKTCFDSWGYLYRFAFIERVRTVAFGVCVFAEREPYNVSPGTFGGEWTSDFQSSVIYMAPPSETCPGYNDESYILSEVPPGIFLRMHEIVDDIRSSDASFDAAFDFELFGDGPTSENYLNLRSALRATGDDAFEWIGISASKSRKGLTVGLGLEFLNTNSPRTSYTLYVDLTDDGFKIVDYWGFVCTSCGGGRY